MPTLKDVAKAANVSVSTASRALNGAKLGERLSEECVDRVRRVAQEVGYTEGYHRRAIRSGRTEVLGVVLEQNGPTDQPIFPSPLVTAYIGGIVAGVEQATHAAGYNLSLVVPSREQRANVRALRQLLERRMDGLILPPCNTSEYNTVVLRESPKLPIVAVQPSVPTELPSVMYHTEVAVDLLVQHLADLGHRRLLYFGPDHKGLSGSAYERERHFFAAVARLGLRGESRLAPVLHDLFAPIPDELQANERTHSFGSILSESRDAQGNPWFTAVIGYNDVFAVTACRILTHAGFTIPRDCSVVGVDNLNPDHMMLQLTTVDLRLNQLGTLAGNWLIRLLDGGKEALVAARNQREILRPHLVTRESSGPAPASASLKSKSTHTKPGKK